jgi:hypothetical protein
VRVRHRVGRGLQRGRVALADWIRPGPKRLVFVTGSYRSGTTAVADFLGAHPAAIANSESRLLVAVHSFLDEVRRFQNLERSRRRIDEHLAGMVLSLYHAQGRHAPASVVVDKEPLGPIGLPAGDYESFVSDVLDLGCDTRVVYMVRDPVETVWSMTQRRYGFSLTSGDVRTYELDEHLEHYRRSLTCALALASRPNVLLCSFDALRHSPVRQTACLSSFTGLPGLQPFRPRPTAEIGFSEGEVALVRSSTDDLVSVLNAMGVVIGASA